MNTLTLRPLAVALCLAALLPPAALARDPAICLQSRVQVGYTAGSMIHTYGVKLSPEAAAKFCSAYPECVADLHDVCERARSQGYGYGPQQTVIASDQSEPQAITPTLS